MMKVLADLNPYSEYESGSTKLLNTNLIWIWIHNTQINEKQYPYNGTSNLKNRIAELKTFNFLAPASFLSLLQLCSGPMLFLLIAYISAVLPVLCFQAPDSIVSERVRRRRHIREEDKYSVADSGLVETRQRFADILDEFRPEVH